MAEKCSEEGWNNNGWRGIFGTQAPQNTHRGGGGAGGGMLKLKNGPYSEWLNDPKFALKWELDRQLDCLNFCVAATCLPNFWVAVNRTLKITHPSQIAACICFSVSEMLHNLKWTNLSTRRSVNRLTIIYKILNGHSAITPDNFFEFNKTQMRKKHNLTLRTYQPRGNIDKFAFVQRSIPEWNTLPNVVVQANSTEQFKVLLEKHLQQNPLPSLAF